MIIGIVPVVIVTVMFVHCEITACDSDNKQSLILSYLPLVWVNTTSALSTPLYYVRHPVVLIALLSTLAVDVCQ